MVTPCADTCTQSDLPSFVKCVLTNFWWYCCCVLHQLAGKVSLEDFSEKLLYDRFRLRLVCEKCGVPQGDGYPLNTPKDWVAKMLPAMKVSSTSLLSYQNGCQSCHETVLLLTLPSL